MDGNLYIQMRVFADGERFPILFGRDRLPLFEPLVWTATMFRSGSAATMEQALRGALFIHLFCERHGLNLARRMGRGKFFSQSGIESLTRDASLPIRILRRPMKSRSRNNTSKSAVPSDAKLLRRLPIASKTEIVSPSTVAQRLLYGAQYLAWLAERRVAAAPETAHGGKRAEDRVYRYMVNVNDTLAKVRAHIPRSSPGTREGIGDQAKNLLLKMIETDSPNNPWSRAFIQLRNQVIVTFFLKLGLRQGELLGAYRRDFDRRFGLHNIVRRQDNANDPRKRQPNSKTRERTLPLDEDLIKLVERYLVMRNKITGSRTHDFLFVAQNGSPLSESSITGIFKTIRHAEPELRLLCAHILRHQWNDDYSEQSDRAGTTEKEEADTRRYLMGWSDKSEMPAHYGRRRIRTKATEHSLNMQRALMGQKTGPEDQSN